MSQSTTGINCLLSLWSVGALLLSSSSFQVSAFSISHRFQQQQQPALATTASRSSVVVSPHHHQQFRQRQQDSVWQLHEIIRADVWDAEPFDVGQGGVRLAMQSAVKVSGTVQHRPGKAEAKPVDLIRYRELQPLAEATVTKVLHEMKAELICMGQAKELYKDPGSTTVKEVVYAPHEAMKDALQEAGSVLNSDRIVINVLGGDDLQLLEVIDALHYLVVSLDANTKSKIFFNSLSHSSVPSGTTSVTVVAFPHVPAKAFEGDADLEATTAATPLTGLWPAAEKAVSKGEVYALNGNWWTVVDADVNPDTE